MLKIALIDITESLYTEVINSQKGIEYKTFSKEDHAELSCYNAHVILVKFEKESDPFNWIYSISSGNPAHSIKILLVDDIEDYERVEAFKSGFHEVLSNFKSKRLFGYQLLAWKNLINCFHKIIIDNDLGEIEIKGTTYEVKNREKRTTLTEKEYLIFSFLRE
ncbi:MAG: hypothetical protein ACI9QD_001238, partial [Thermoproteota archaeon]